MADQEMKAKMTIKDFATVGPKFSAVLDPRPFFTAPPPLPPSPPPATPLPPPPTPVFVPPEVPAAPATNPFNSLPFRSPGDRIKSEDFNALSQSLKTVYDMSVLSGSLFGLSFAEAKLVLASQQYQIQRVMTVFGAEIDNLADTSLDNRKVVQILMVLGERGVRVVVTEAVETRRFAPNLLGQTYRQGAERLQALLGEITFPTTPINASQLIGLSLKEASQKVSK
jgi:hypothetical protein